MREREIAKRYMETWGSKRNVWYLDFMNIYIQMRQIVLFKYVKFIVCTIYLQKVVKKKERKKEEYSTKLSK